MHSVEARASLLSIYSTRLPYMAGARQQLARRELQVQTERRLAPPCYLIITHTSALWQERSSNSHGACYGVYSGGSRLPSLREANYGAHCHIWQERARGSHGASCRNRRTHPQLARRELQKRCGQSGGLRLLTI